MSADGIHVELWGTEPAPQGSKTPWGTEANPNTKPWREALAAAAVEARGDRPILEGSVALVVAFYFHRPKGHFGTGKNAGILKGNAPRFKDSKPDLDKLLRAVGDALTGSAIRDDARIVSVTAIKLYSDATVPAPGVRLTVVPAP